MRLLGYNSPWDAHVVPFTFFFTLNDPILCQGISNTTAFFIGRSVFYKSVCNRYNKETKKQLRRKSNLVHLHVQATP